MQLTNLCTCNSFLFIKYVPESMPTTLTCPEPFIMSKFLLCSLRFIPVLLKHIRASYQQLTSLQFKNTSYCIYIMYNIPEDSIQYHSSKRILLFDKNCLLQSKIICSFDKHKNLFINMTV